MKSEELRAQLHRANVTNDMISRGVRLTSRGMAKLASKIGVTEEEVMKMLRELTKKVKDEIKPTGLPSNPGLFEDKERYSYEADILGNVQLRDRKTGASHYLAASEGAKFLREVDRVGINYQGLIAPYFEKNLMEFASEDVATDEMGNTGGTYNFPWSGYFACARFWLANGEKPMVEVVSVVDEEGHEVPLDQKMKAEADRAAWEWVNKV